MKNRQITKSFQWSEMNLKKVMLHWHVNLKWWMSLNIQHVLCTKERSCLVYHFWICYRKRWNIIAKSNQIWNKILQELLIKLKVIKNKVHQNQGLNKWRILFDWNFTSRMYTFYTKRSKNFRVDKLRMFTKKERRRNHAIKSLRRNLDSNIPF